MREGKIRAIGLSEVSSSTLRARRAPHCRGKPSISLWSRDVERGTLAACAELGVAFVAFSPLGRGFLSAGVDDPASLPANDIRRAMPRFQTEAWAHNLACLQGLRELASEQGCSMAQLALAWVLQQGPLTGADAGHPGHHASLQQPWRCRRYPHPT